MGRRRRRRRPARPIRLLLVGLVAAGLALGLWLSRIEPPPSDLGDACAIFTEKPAWRESLEQAEAEFGVPAPVQLAIIHQESRFLAGARPPRGRLFWVLPGRRRSTAYGFAQVLDGTWDEYRRRTGRPRAARHRFGDVAHFIGWYGAEIHRRTGVATDDPYHLYLAYHEGPSGFQRGRHEEKAWLLRVAGAVERRADRYAEQLSTCPDAGRGVAWWRWLALVGLVLAIGLLLARSTR